MNRTSIVSPQTSPKIQRTGDPQQLGFGPVPASKPRPAICEWADRLAEFDVDAACQGVALQLASYANKHGGCFPSIETLAARVQLKKRQCRRHLKTLARKGLIVSKRHGRGACNSYRLIGYGWGDDRPVPPKPNPQEGSYMTPQEGSCTTPEGNQEKVSKSELRASAVLTSTVRTQKDGSKARPFKGAVSPIPEPSPERRQAALELLKSDGEAFEASLMGRTAQELHTGQTEAVKAPAALGCPECGHTRLMGGSCDQCGHDIGTGFRASADWNTEGARGRFT